jgi:hypothetical protein
MTRIRSFWKPWLTSTIVASFVLASPGRLASEILGTGSDPMLAALAAALHAHGIDVVPGQARDLVFKRSLRPRLAKLAGFPIVPGVAGTNDGRGWSKPFDDGALGYVASYRPASNDTNPASEADAADAEKFLSAWRNVEEDARVFVAFTRADVESAQKVADAFRAKGYVVFTYLKSGEATPWANPEIVGRLFREAGHHLVIDSPKARESSGVVFEALALARLKETTRRSSPSTGGAGCADVLGAR